MLSFLFLSLFATSGIASSQNPLTEDYQIQQQVDFSNEADHLSKVRIKPSTWADVKSWKSIGTRFAGAYNASGDLIAIYDLSYPTFKFPTTLGTVSNVKADAQTMLSAFRQAKASVLESDLPAAQKIAIKNLKQIETVTEAAYLHENWWKDLPWKSKSFLKFEPSSFRLSDLDLPALRVGNKFTSDLRQFFQLILNDTVELDAVDGAEILNAFQFVRTSGGALELRWSDPRKASAESRPRKLLDLVSTRQGLYDNIKFTATIAVLTQATNAIPVPVIGALLSTAISRIGRYYSMIQTEHLEMLHELITENNERSFQDSELLQMSPSVLSAITDAFEWKRVQASDSWKWIFTHTQKSWRKGERRDSDWALAAQSWFAAQGEKTADLNNRFSFGWDADQSKSLYLNSATRSQSNRAPTRSIDYANPDAIAKSRLMKEWIGVGVEFGSHMVPLLGFAVTEAYRLMVQNAVDHAEFWEARLLQHLENRTENWDFEISTLENQRINPFEITHAEMKDLVNARRLELGL